MAFLLGEWLYRVLFLGSGLLGLTLYKMLLEERKRWETMEMFQGGLYFLLLPFASHILSFYLLGNGDPLILFLFRLTLIANAAVGAIFYMNQDSSDPTVASSATICNILIRSVMVICTVYATFYTNVFTQSAMRADLIYLALMLGGNISHLRKLTRSEGSLKLGSSVSLFLTIDAFITIMLGNLLLGFSDMFLNALTPAYKIQDGHLALTKSLGCIILGGSVFSFSSLCFKYTDDALATLKSKLVFYVPALLVAAMNYYTEANFDTNGQIAFMGLMGALSLNACSAVLWQKLKEE